MLKAMSNPHGAMELNRITTPSYDSYFPRAPRVSRALLPLPNFSQCGRAFLARR
jgi:hypothetical protein